jgi:hypothetical protein
LAVVLSAAVSFESQQLLGNEPTVVPVSAKASSGQLNWVRPGTASRSTTQQNLSVAQPIPTNDPAAPHQVTRVTAQPQVAVLRWRTPAASRVPTSPPASSSIDQPIRTVTLAPQQQRTPPPTRTHPVRQVAATDLDLPAAIPDAIEDAPVEASEPPMAISAPATIKIEPAAQTIDRQPAPAAAGETWEDDPPPAPILDTSTRMVQAQEQLPPPGTLQDNNEPPCDRVYNQRDCCDEGDRCDDARITWQRDAIAKISLDITPSMHPRERDPVQQEEKRSRTLAESPARTWRDRQGNVVADGRLTNIKRGRALILDANNQLVPVPFNDLSDDDLCFLTSWWNVPTECTLGDEPYAGRQWAPSTLTWKASALCHKPLYFEEVQLERYGHTAGPLRQPLLSGAHFFASLVTVPYQAGINPPWECRYSLGYYRPGSCAPWFIPPIPLSVRGGLWQAGAIVGGVYIFP